MAPPNSSRSPAGKSARATSTLSRGSNCSIRARVSTAGTFPPFLGRNTRSQYYAIKAACVIGCALADRRKEEGRDPALNFWEVDKPPSPLPSIQEGEEALGGRQAAA